MNAFKLILGLLLISLSLNTYSKDRFICSREDTNEVVNFYISAEKLYLSGLSISGTYSILANYSFGGVLAINMSEIGNETGIEVIFLNFEKKIFSVKSSISNNSKKSTIEIKGTCK